MDVARDCDVPSEEDDQREFAPGPGCEQPQTLGLLGSVAAITNPINILKCYSILGSVNVYT